MERKRWRQDMMSFYAPHSTPLMCSFHTSHAVMLLVQGACLCDEDHAVFEDCFAYWVEDIHVRDNETRSLLLVLSAGWSGSFNELLDAAEALAT